MRSFFTFPLLLRALSLLGLLVLVTSAVPIQNSHPGQAPDVYVGGHPAIVVSPPPETKERTWTYLPSSAQIRKEEDEHEQFIENREKQRLSLLEKSKEDRKNRRKRVLKGAPVKALAKTKTGFSDVVRIVCGKKLSECAKKNGA